MEFFEHAALKQMVYKPIHLKRYIDDIFIVWPHGLEKLLDFLHFLNSMHNNIKFTMEGATE